MSTTARRLYAALTHAESWEDYLEVVRTIEALYTYKILDPEDSRRLAVAMGRVYWSEYYDRVMVNSVE